jgi:hypothetical protein
MGKQTSAKVIRSSSSELFSDAIHTLPVVPEKGNIALLIGPILGTLKTHIAQCISEGAIPYSGLGIDYDKNKVDIQEECFFVGNENSQKQKLAFLEGIIKGGRPYIFGINFDKHNFQTVKQLTDNLITNHYQIYEAEFTLNSRHEEEKTNTGSRSSYFVDLSLDLIKERYYTVQLDSKIGFKISDKVLNWYNALADKYKSK